MSDTYELPAYLSPLIESEHAQLGRIAVLWGQADWLLDELVVAALGLSRKQQRALLDEKMVGQKLNLLKPHLDGISEERARTAAKGFIHFIDQTKTERNRIFHGVWG